MLKDLPFGPQTRAECWPRFLRLAGSWTICGYGNWLVFDKAGAFIGVVGFFDAFRELGPDFDDHRELGMCLRLPMAERAMLPRRASRWCAGWTVNPSAAIRSV